MAKKQRGPGGVQMRRLMSNWNDQDRGYRYRWGDRDDGPMRERMDEVKRQREQKR